MEEFGDDADFSAAFEAAERIPAAASTRLDAPRKPVSSGNTVQQPKPQALPSRSAPSSILVSPRQKGNPILNSVRALPWEYSDIPADFVLGATTCALFLSLKYDRLHPEYIYTRIKALQGKYNLRILLTMVDIQNHEDSLRDLTKTSLINNVTIILCWSAQEAGRYLELFKSYENASPTSIRAHQSTSYSDKLVEFITVPRSINKTDAVGLVSSFGSVRTAVNARPEEVALVAGWGEKKVQRWCNTVREPFRVKKTAKRVIARENTRATMSRELSRADTEPDQTVATRLGISSSTPRNLTQSRPSTVVLADAHGNDTTITRRDVDDDEEMTLLGAGGDVPVQKHKPQQGEGRESGEVPPSALSEGVSAALERLRRGG